MAVKGFNLGDLREVAVKAPALPDGWQTVPLRVKTAQGESLNKLWLAVGNEPEVLEKEPNDNPSEAQKISIPVTINGHIDSNRRSGVADEDYFRFEAKKGDQLTIAVAASRLGSPLDSVIEVLEAQGRPVPRATLRAVGENVLSQSDRDGQSTQL